MGDVTGPISTLPGKSHDFPEGAKCDDHPDRPAVARIQGETDSFGCEMHDMCAECLAEYREEMRAPEASTGKCDWCNARAIDLRFTRDHDEGPRGPVYRVCGRCRTARDEEAAREDSYYDDYDVRDDYDDSEAGDAP